tara:strand:+ start:66 stop:392 length:327 start_codon:yes stop_codon:yes gene_type:complete
MAQNFRRYTSNDVGTSAATLFTANSFDTVVGISVANVTASAVNASVYINDSSNDIYLIKDAPIPAGSALQVLDGGAKFVVQSGDALKVVSDTASSLDVWVSTVDDISS